ncbi:hypothetical protein G9C98_002967 [Cotesia typhae]|uniref:Uncharacterized protein n=1 Tax=Cotesia typhae TaxID=2053667 RepID=A0A8J5RA19_9HYME|nr:hypothetical protein G9C98_002967 [Cotesia typhae]
MLAYEKNATRSHIISSDSTNLKVNNLVSAEDNIIGGIIKAPKNRRLKQVANDVPLQQISSFSVPPRQNTTSVIISDNTKNRSDHEVIINKDISGDTVIPDEVDYVTTVANHGTDAISIGSEKLGDDDDNINHQNIHGADLIYVDNHKDILLAEDTYETARADEMTAINMSTFDKKSVQDVIDEKRSNCQRKNPSRFRKSASSSSNNDNDSEDNEGFGADDLKKTILPTFNYHGNGSDKKSPEPFIELKSLITERFSMIRLIQPLKN